MSVTFDPTSDFAEVADSLESLTVTSNGGALTVNFALKRRVSEREAEASGGRFTRSDVKWLAAESEFASPPQIGGTVTDGDGRVWTILQIDRDAITCRFRLWTRELSLNVELTDRITIQKSTWTKDDHGSVQASWSDAAANLPARVQPVNSRVEMEHDEQLLRATHVVYLASAVEIDETQRIVISATNETFRVLGVENEERIDALMTVMVEKEM